MNKPRFVVFKYKHGDPMPVPAGQKILAGILLLAGVGFLFVLPPVTIGALIVAAIVYFVPPSGQLKIGPRYLICGNTIIYYHNITRITKYEGYLEVHTATGSSLTVHQGNFPTNARKSEKIAANTLAKFEKAAERILAKARAVCPSVTITVRGQGGM